MQRYLRLYPSRTPSLKGLDEGLLLLDAGGRVVLVNRAFRRLVSVLDDRDLSGTDGMVLVTVADTGPGIPDDVREAIFSRFEQGKARGSGQGLGLSICRMLADRYGGRIWVEDRVAGRPEEGAAFRFTLRKAGGGEPGKAAEQSL